MTTTTRSPKEVDEDGRRCLDADEMEAAGFHRDRWGRWQQPKENEPKMLARVAL